MIELWFYMRFVTPPIQFGRVILYVWNSHPRSQSSKDFFCSFMRRVSRVVLTPLCFP